LWKGRFKSTLVGTESYLLTLYRYIELNPVRARMVEHPAAYPWSSYHGNAGDRDITLLTPHALYSALGKTDTKKICLSKPFDITSAGQYNSSRRDATNKSWALGDEAFIEQVSNTLSRRVMPSPQGGNRRSKVFNALKIR
jgi:putative transposase